MHVLLYCFTPLMGLAHVVFLLFLFTDGPLSGTNIFITSLLQTLHTLSCHIVHKRLSHRLPTSYTFCMDRPYSWTSHCFPKPSSYCALCFPMDRPSNLCFQTPFLHILIPTLHFIFCSSSTLFIYIYIHIYVVEDDKTHYIFCILYFFKQRTCDCDYFLIQ